MSRTSVWLLGLGLLGACKDPALNVENERVPSRAATTAEAPAARTAQATTATAAQARATAAPGGHAKAAPIQWEDSIPWKSWEEGSKLAKATNKPIFLLVFADWCPHCRNLKAVFADPEVQKLAENMVMIRQDADDDSATWLAGKVGSYGSYVPRIFFLSPDGNVRPEINSTNARFPYFYTPEGVGLLKASMKRAQGG